MLKQINSKILFILFFSSSFAFAQPGALDMTFVSGTASSTGNITTTAIQSDGKLLIGGNFTSYNGTLVNGIARVKTNGVLDSTFNFSSGTGANGNVNEILVQPDGKIIIVGNFTNYKGTSINRIVRLNTNGTIDPTFTVTTGANATIYCAALQPDGKILIAGSFSSYNGTARSRLARINSNGTIDNTFTVGAGPSDWPYAMAIQPDGNIIIVGNFLTYAGTTVNRVARISSTGTLDNNFTINAGSAISGASVYGYAVDLQSDGKIIIGGAFTTFNGVLKSNILRLTSSGAVDNTFNAGATNSNGIIYSCKVLEDDRILIGGTLNKYNNITIPGRIACLNANGTRDASFNSGGAGAASSYVLDITLNSNKDIFIGGAFVSYNGVTRNKLAKLFRSCSNASITSLSASSYSNCGTLSTTLSITSGTLNDATSWQWYEAGCGTGSVGSGTSIVVSPSTTTTYYVRGEGSCTNATSCSTITIVVNPIPTISVSPSSPTVCVGSIISLTASGGSTYTWSPGNLSGANVAVSPTVNTTYTVVANDVNGCTNNAITTVTVTNCVPQTQLTSTWCNTTITTMDANTKPRCDAVTNATNYEWQFTNVANGQVVFTKIRGAQWPDFYLTGYFTNIQYNTTYSVKVRAYVGGIWGNYGPACTLTTPTASITTTQLESAFCNTTLTTMDSNTKPRCDALTGATDYEWQFTDISTGQVVLTRQRGAQWTDFYLTSYFPNIQYNKTYSIKIRAFINNGWAAFGPACTLTTPTALGGLTQLTPTFCNTTLPTLDANTKPRCNTVTGATNYEWQFSNPSTGAILFTKQRNASYTDFYLTSYWPGIAYSTTYNVRVRAYTNNTWGAFGNICTLTTPATAGGKFMFTQAEMDEIDAENNIMINAYPNPTNGKLNIDASETITAVSIYNIAGELIKKEENTHQVDLSAFSNGLYLIHVKTENNSKTIRVIKD